MFNKKYEFEVVEVFESGARVKHYLKGTKKEIKKDIEAFKNISKEYELIGKKGIIVWR